MKTLPKVILVSFFVSYLLMDALLLVAWLVQGNTLKIITTLIRAAIAGGLFWATYRGAQWARNVLGLLLGAALVLGLVLLVPTFHPLQIAWLIYAGSFLFVLIFWRPAQEFFRLQREQAATKEDASGSADHPATSDLPASESP